MSEFVAIIEIDDPDERMIPTEEMGRWLTDILGPRFAPMLKIRKVEVREVETT